jgi:hypothetical protein
MQAGLRFILCTRIHLTYSLKRIIVKWSWYLRGEEGAKEELDNEVASPCQGVKGSSGLYS